MIRTIIILILFMLAEQSFCQTNLVPNPSFEQYQTCPYNFGQITGATGWSSFRSSPDYYNSCADFTTGISVPKSDAGFQIAADGNAYIGLIGFLSGQESEFEAAGNSLTSPLVIGTKYFLSFEASLSSIDSTGCNAASNKLGMTFSKNIYDLSNQKPLDNSAKLFSSNIIQDTANWVKVSGSFIADSAYNYVIIGNFFNIANTNTINLFPNQTVYGSYYFIDNICVSTDSLYCASITNIKKATEKIKFRLFPNPSSNYLNIEVPKYLSTDLTLTSIDGATKFVTKNYRGQQIDISNLHEGLYFIELIIEGQTYFDKLLIQR